MNHHERANTPSKEWCESLQRPRIARAITIFALRLEPIISLSTVRFGPALTYRRMAEYYIVKGAYDKAAEAVGQPEKLGPSDPENLMWKGFLAAKNEERAKAIETINKLKESSGERVNAIWIAPIYFALGDSDEFLRLMALAKEDHQLPQIELMHSPICASIRANPLLSKLLFFRTSRVSFRPPFFFLCDSGISPKEWERDN
jgi:tetratricopeptide (TPR) repeat protein